MKQIIIDFLYIDLNTCERCVTAYGTLKAALRVLSGVFDTLGYQVKVSLVNITSKELAEEYRLLSSPTLRVNGMDICSQVIESECKACSDLCGGDTVNCRVFVYEGVEYEKPPVAMIAEGILKAVFCPEPNRAEAYVLPDNLDRFFSGKNSCYDNTKSNNNLRSDFPMKAMSVYEPAMCCETGLCGVSIDPELLRISAVFNNLQKNGVTASRFNLNNAPQAFINNTAINELINGEGVEALPATVIDGKIVKTRVYPTNDEIASWLEIPASYLGEEAAKTARKGANDGCDCKRGCC